MLFYEDMQYAQLVFEYLNGRDDWDYYFTLHEDGPDNETRIRTFMDWLEIELDKPGNHPFSFEQYHLAVFHQKIPVDVLTDVRRRFVARIVGDYLDTNYGVQSTPAELYAATDVDASGKAEYVVFMNQTRGPTECGVKYYDDNLSMVGDD